MNSRAPRRAPGRPQSRPGRPQPGRAGQRRPLPTGGPLFTPGAGAARRSVESRSARVLLLLHQQPRWLVPGVFAGLLIAGLALAGVAGAVLLGLLAAALGWFAYLSWPALGGQSRMLRAAAIAVVLLLAVIQLRR